MYGRKGHRVCRYTSKLFWLFHTLHLVSLAWFYVHTVHDTENLTFSADDRTENPHISARTISGFRADNQRIPCGTISKFDSYNDISNDPCGVFLDLFSNRIRTEDSCPSARKIRARPHGKSAAPARKFRGTRAEHPRRSARNNHRIPRKKFKFSVSCTVYAYGDAQSLNFIVLFWCELTLL